MAVLLEDFLAVEDAHIADCQRHDFLVWQAAGVLRSFTLYL